ncbi:class I SAM-dependent methyltransferase [Actinomycetospora soli]|uniref:class I SAM-dependent methyltransferase n=1 Tax=Actinomycetospora soli TaxID=2893887 RepID=UPI001E4D6F63|nr:class I SAM-dependent methyltransferase [Actinomycetospora soli]MCD2187636.1 class I SAM-dependent methyltransferase [Actinomycetospora soli]
MTDAARAVWDRGDYGPLGDLLAPAGPVLLHAAGLRAGDRVVDLAAGHGSIAVEVARRGIAVAALDVSPVMVAAGRTRTAGLPVTWLEGDLAAVPLDDGSADVVLSNFGLIFAVDAAPALAEVRRLLRPGGTLAYTAWDPDGVVGRMGAVMAEFMPAPPDGAPRRFHGSVWTTGEAVRAAGFTEVATETRTLPWRFGSPAELTTFFRHHSPAHIASAAAAGERADDMFTAIERVFAPDGGPVDVQAPYAVVTARA